MGVRIVLIPTIAATAGLQAAWEALNELRENGMAAMNEWNARADRSRWGRPDRAKLLGTEKVREIEERYMPKELQRDYEATWGHKTDYSAVAKPRRRRAGGEVGLRFVRTESLPRYRASFDSARCALPPTAGLQRSSS